MKLGSAVPRPTLAREEPFDELLAQLHRYSKELFFEVGGMPGGPTELVITAEGRRDAFDSVTALVDAAPPLEGWEFVALKPAAGFAFVTEYGAARIAASSSWFMPLESSSTPSLLGVRIACDEYADEFRDDFLSAAHIVIDTGLRERVAADCVQHVDVERAPPSPSELGYIELPQLAAYVEWRQRKRATH